MTILEYTLKEPKDLFIINAKLDQWIFRGQKLSSWTLQTTLERASVEHIIPDLNHYERFIISKFKQNYHLYNTNVPSDENLIDWASVIQHHGGPTRLLDFSESLFVGTYFATDLNPGEAVVWCVNLNPLIQNELKSRKKTEDNKAPVGHGLVLYDHGYVEASSSIENGDKELGIYAVKPMWGNKRLFLQQGLFLVQRNIQNYTFLENLYSELSLNTKDVITVVDLENEISNQHGIVKIIIPDSLDLKFSIMKLLRSMNIHEATLFPGIDGFARSLKFLQEYARFSAESRIKYLEQLRKTIHDNRFRRDT